MIASIRETEKIIKLKDFKFKNSSSKEIINVSRKSIVSFEIY